jgi:hypothetical protein
LEQDKEPRNKSMYYGQLIFSKDVQNRERIFSNKWCMVSSVTPWRRTKLFHHIYKSTPDGLDLNIRQSVKVLEENLWGKLYGICLYNNFWK